MNSVPSPELRISDDERESALRALGEHMSVGRVDVAEYDERSGKITAAKTRGDLAEIFRDLPQPHPKFGTAAQSLTRPASNDPTAEPEQHAPMSWADRPLAQRVGAAAVPISAVLGVVLFFATGIWLWFLLPAVVTVIGSSLWGSDWRIEQRANRRGHRRGRRGRH